jgi:hypothetical protein
MSSALLSSLPRFDKDDQHPAEQLKRMLGQMQAAAARPAAAPPVEDIAEAEETAAPELDLAPSLAEVEGLIGELSSALTRIEAESRNQAMQVTQSLAARLFPELSRKFLAEEIGQHLTRLVPASAPAVEIRARPQMLEKLEPIIAGHPDMSGRYTLVPAGVSDGPRVLVSWKTGGVTFDFEGLLAACLAHLDPAQTLIEE